jgi:antitoxin (DNA-binding transcriptional repressor) of toxin-antitoxin stability system
MSCGTSGCAKTCELRQKFGHYVARVKKGETLIITKRGREIARFEPTPAREHGIEVLPPS